MSLASAIPGLTAFGRKNAGILHSLAKTGVSPRELFKDFTRATGQRVPFRVFERNLKQIGIASGQWNNLKFVARNRVIRSNIIPSTINFPDRFRTVIRMKVSAQRTDELGNLFTDTQDRWVSVMHSEPMTRGRLEALARGRVLMQGVGKIDYDVPQEVLESRPVMAFENRRFNPEALSF